MNLRHRLRALFRRRDLEAEMAEEMRFHLEQRAGDLAESGLPAAEARLAAQRRFGNVASLQEQARDAFGWGALARFGRDLAFAARQLGRSPGFSLLAVVTLALGIGANTAMFSLVNGIVLKPLPYAHLAQLDRIWRATPQYREGNFPLADFLDLQRHGGDYGDITGYTLRSASLADPGLPPEPVNAALAAPNLFAVLGVSTELGRPFLPEEGIVGRHRVVVLSQRVWNNRYGRQADIVGRTVRIDGEPHEVIGVLPASFNDWRFLGFFDVFLPFAPDESAATDRQSAGFRVIGRRHPGVDPHQADALLAEQAARTARAFPAENAGTTWWREDIQATASGSGGGITLSLLIALSLFVLLLACANLANLFLVRTITRTREYALRAALGASRLQLLRPLVAESLLLSLAGGTAALLVVTGFHHWARLRSTGDNGEQVVLQLDGGVLAWTLGAALFTTLAFGLAPALYAARLDLNEIIKNGGRGTTGGRGAQRFRRLLVVGQFALALVLLAGAAIFIRGLDDLHHRRGGWDVSAVATGSLALPAATYPDAASLQRFQRQALERLGTLPGVESAAFASHPPYFYSAEIVRLLVEEHARPAAGAEPAARLNSVTPGYFTTVGTPLVAGRLFDDRDLEPGRRSYLISQTTARALFGSANPLGRRLAPATTGATDWGEIVGVVADVETVEPDANLVPLQLYRPLGPDGRRAFDLFVRVRGTTPLGIIPDLRAALARLDPDLPVQSLRPAQDAIGRSLYQQGVLRDMLAAFGLLGLALASLGIYGILARTIAQRSGEFAIRLALGASARDITALIFANGARLVAIGAVLGLAGAVGVAHLLIATYPGIRVNSPAVLATATAFLTAVALLACWLPARRARRIDALAVLRAD